MITNDQTTPKRTSANAGLEDLDLFGKITNYFDSKLEDKFQKLDRQYEQKQIVFKKPKKTNSFKFKGNQDQFEFNTEILEQVEEIEYLHKQGSSSRFTKRVKILKADLEKRNKLIRMADRSPAGWGIVKEYLSDEIASDSDDEKRIRAAETRAIRKHNKNKTSYTSSTVSKPPDQTFRNASGNYTDKQHQSNSRENTQKPGNCFACAKPGHWRKNCPNYSQRPNTQYKSQV